MCIADYARTALRERPVICSELSKVIERMVVDSGLSSIRHKPRNEEIKLYVDYRISKSEINTFCEKKKKRNLQTRPDVRSSSPKTWNIFRRPQKSSQVFLKYNATHPSSRYANTMAIRMPTHSPFLSVAYPYDLSTAVPAILH